MRLLMADSIAMRVFWGTAITVGVMAPSVPLFIRQEMSPDDFGIRFILAVLFSVVVTGIAATFIKATGQPAAGQPQRRKDDDATQAMGEVSGEPR